MRRYRAARRRLIGGSIVYVALLLAILWLGNVWARDRAITQAVRSAQTLAASRASLLVSELQKYRLLPIVLGEYPDARAALEDPAGIAASRLDGKLEQLGRMTGSSAIYLIDAHGRTIAASNARLPTSFVGQNYGFRPYFTIAMKRGAAEFFGLGTVSGRPGLYFARRVGAPAHAGVIVVKFEFDTVERGWASANAITYVTDEDGVILITNRPNWRFRTTGVVSAYRLAAFRRARQFGEAALSPLPLRLTGNELATLPDRARREGRYAIGTLPVPVLGWRLRALEPIEPIEAAYQANARLVVVAAAVLLVIPLILWLRARESADIAAVARVALEEQVTLRTAELEQTQTRFREAREELEHANRLGSIGQITAAVAHEINQPIAAIRAFADNGGELLFRGKQDEAAINLAAIAGLTERIGQITAELRTYARRGSGRIRATSLERAIERALLLTGHRLRGGAIRLERAGDAHVEVMADPLRLEQILVNLIGNAIEALANAANPQIALIVEQTKDAASVVLADNGGGIALEIVETMFTPFATSKPDGLGLGLGIARDIAREFGGELDVADPPAGYQTSFRLELRRPA